MSTRTPEELIRELADKDAIRELVHCYAHCIWHKDIEGTADLFTIDGVMDTGERPPIRGRQALLDEYRTMLSAIELHPMIHDLIIVVDGDRATGRSHLDVRATVAGKSMIGAGDYEDEYARIGSAWKFKSRKLRMSYFVPLEQGWARRE